MSMLAIFCLSREENFMSIPLPTKGNFSALNLRFAVFEFDNRKLTERIAWTWPKPPISDH
jgi:hypothetical protein